MHNPWTKAVDLEQWAARSEARQKLPAVVRRLIWATTKGKGKFSFPAEEGVQRPDWDGKLTVDIGNPWISAGKSVFEMSVGNPPATKAAENYKKRTGSTPAADAANSTFVFVTPRKWTDRQTWADERKAEGVWKDVCVLDSDDLEHWLEIAPAVDIWIARLVGKIPSGVRDLSYHWDLLAALTSPPLPAAAFLAGRESSRDELQSALNGNVREVQVAALSDQEVIDFIAAAFGSLYENDELPARLVLVETREAWNQIAACTEPLVLIPASGLALDRTNVVQALKSGHHVVTRRPYSTQADNGTIRLPRAWRHELSQSLIAAGFPKNRAERLARESGGFLTAVQRLASSNAGTVEPVWAHDSEGSRLLPFILFGAWDDAKEGDREVIARLTGDSYANALALASGWLIRPETPFRRTGTEWQFISREDSWLYLAPRLTRPLLDLFVSIIVAVLTEDDPRFDLTPDQRPFAVLRDKVPRHSQALRKGLAETLALLGADLIPLPALPLDTGAAYAGRIVRNLLPANLSKRRWSTLAPLLELFAEAAPVVFLEVIERDVFSPQPSLLGLFVSDDDGVFGMSPHYHLMWALNALAWHPDYLSRAALILARLAVLDPGGKTNPRPDGSLHDIFRLWLPQTAANTESRFQVIDLLIEREPTTAWKLLVQLLPTGFDTASPTYPPRWREWPSAKKARVSRHELDIQIGRIAERMLRLSKKDSAKLLELTGHVDHLPDNEFIGLTEHLLTLDLSTTPPAERIALWNVLHRLIRDHEYFTTAEWRMTENRLAALHKVEEHLRPEAAVDRGRWLFAQHHVYMGKYQETPHETQEEMAFVQRRAILSEIFAAGGIRTIAEFAATLDYPGLVADALGRCNLYPDWSNILPAYFDDPNPGIVVFARAYAWTVFSQHGWSWVEALPIREWTPSATTEILTVLPFSQRIWDLACSLGLEVKTAYWKKVRPFPRELNSAQAADAVRQLLKHDRPLDAADFVPMAYHNKLTLPESLLAETLEKCVPALNRTAASGRDVSMLFHDLEVILKQLQDSPAADPSRVANLEWIYLPLMKHRAASPKFLHRELARDPAFFAQCVELVWPGDIPAVPPLEKTEANRSRALLAYQLLDSWETHPSLLVDSGPDETALRTWVDEARKKCEANGRLEACDHQIGGLLASSPAAPDGSWPCVAIRNILESLAGDTALNSFQTGIFNGRGGTWRGLHDGGAQERELAKKYHAYADANQMKWPRIASALRELANNYEADARFMDERAEEHI